MYFIKINSIDTFCNSIFSNKDFNHCHIKTFKTNQQKNKVILGRIFKVFPYSADIERYLLLVTEYQRNNQYGQIFKVAINGKVAKTLNSFSPQPGDKIAFLNPFYCKNPSYKVNKLRNRVSHNQPRHLLVVNPDATVWFAQQKNRSQSVRSVKEKSKGGKSENKMISRKSENKTITNNNCCEAEKSRKEVADNVQPQPSGANQSREVEKSRKEVADNVQPQHSRANQSKEAEKSRKEVADNVRPHPAIQLQKNQSANKNPPYHYKSIYSIHKADEETSVNLMAVIQEITKPVCPTQKKKFMMKCILVDDSVREGAELKFYFFFHIDSLMRQFEVGDVVRLHRAKLERFHGELDGRIFFEHDAVLFKSGWPAVAHIATTQTIITDDEKERVAHLLKWYMNRPKDCLLSDITEEGTFNVTVRVMIKPKRKDDKVVVAISDGRIHRLKPYPYSNGEDEEITRGWRSIVAELVVSKNLDSFTGLQKKCYLHLHYVDAVKNEAGQLCLQMNCNKPFKEIYRKSDKATEIKKLVWEILHGDKPTPNGDDTSNSSFFSGQESEIQKSPQNERSPTRIDADDASSPNKKSRTCQQGKETSLQNKRSSSGVHAGNAATSGDEGLSSKQNIQEASLCKRSPTGVNKDASRSDQENGPSNKKSRTTSPAKNTSKPDNGDKNSCVFGVKTMSHVNDGKNNESDRVTKSRKQLYTPNYTTDLSEAATDETSELNEETSKQPKLTATAGNTLLPANTSFKDIIEMCSSMQQGQLKGAVGKQPNKPKQLVVMLEKINEECLLKTSQKRSAESETSDNIDLETAENTSKKRRKSAESDISETRKLLNPETDSLDVDAETVINFCLQATKKRRRVELADGKASPSEADFFESNSRVEPLPIQSSTSQLESRDRKVTEWLLHPKNDIEGREEIVHSEVNVSTAKTLMNCEGEAGASDPTNYIHLEHSRILAIYMDGYPDTARNPLDLVSGYCRDGCRGISCYSAMHWRQDGPYDVPLCPDCVKLEKECELQLMFMLELEIVDPTKRGQHDFVLVCRKPAEEFLNCTVAEYLGDPVIRESRCRLLREYRLMDTYKSTFSPILDICVAPLDDEGKILLLTDTYLKLPRP